MRTSVWKATTAGALGLALLFAFRSPFPRHAAAATADPSVAAPAAADAVAMAAVGPDTGPARSAVLATRLRAARGTEDACAVVDALSRIGDATAGAAILEAARSRSHVDVRQCAIAALGHLPGEGAVDLLLQASHDPEPTLRDAAMTALAEREDDLSRSIVIGVARSEDPTGRVSAMIALAHARVPGSAAVIEAAIPGALATDVPRLTLALGDSGDPACAPTLARLVRSPVDSVRDAALTASARLGGSAMTVVQAFYAGGGKDALAVIDAVSAVDSDDVRALLIRATDDPLPAVAAKALETLASFDGEDVRAAVVMHAGSRSPAVATAAARWLALRGDATAVASL
ncbi:MAG TPA: HEAT repeat domain-containing protein, partial [Polyangiaceae bacterium]